MKRRAATRGQAVKMRSRKTLPPKRRKTLKGGRVPALAELQDQLDRRTRELAEAREQKTAISEVLKIISSSPGDLAPVFKTMLANAVRICDAKFGHLWRREGDDLRVGAMHGAPQAFTAYLREEPVFRPKPETGLGQLLLNKQLFQLTDIAAVPTYGDKLREATIKLAGREV